ncbi:beta-ketoacyl synthase N-terminal-like domain-containing protein [Streptomyces sp. URMC 123]|uniref:beta-ketoacyl synthase N-terminal-like domain-containing protein n=1 Tax=Streptomyces sp. URMC 123 TaxID=3423403 RepID=UPI003F1A4F4D
MPGQQPPRAGCGSPGPTRRPPRPEDVQHRLLLEKAREALEDAGIPSVTLTETPAGVLISATDTAYTGHPEAVEAAPQASCPGSRLRRSHGRAARPRQPARPASGEPDAAGRADHCPGRLAAGPWPSATPGGDRHGLGPGPYVGAGRRPAYRRSEGPCQSRSRAAGPRCIGSGRPAHTTASPLVPEPTAAGFLPQLVLPHTVLLSALARQVPAARAWRAGVRGPARCRRTRGTWSWARGRTFRPSDPGASWSGDTVVGPARSAPSGALDEFPESTSRPSRACQRPV